MKTTFHKIFTLALAACMLYGLCVRDVSGAVPDTEENHREKAVILQESEEPVLRYAAAESSVYTAP